MNTYLAASLADDRRRQYASDAAAQASAYAGLRTAHELHSAQPAARRHHLHIRPVRAFRTWLAAGLL